MNLDQLFVALTLLGLLLLAGKWLRMRVALFGRLFLPSAILAGTLGLLMGPQVLGRLQDAWLAGGLFPESTLAIWSQLPGLLISIVFAGLFLGKVIPGPKAIWRRAGPMVAHGQTLATVGVVAGVLLGTLLVNWGTRTGRLELKATHEMDPERFSEHDERESVPRLASTRSIDPLSIHLGFFALAVAIGRWSAAACSPPPRCP